MQYDENTIFIYKSFSKSVACSHSQCRWTASYTFTERFVDKNCIVDKIHHIAYACVNLGGGTLKRQATKRSLRCPYEYHILTAKQLYQFACEEIKGMNLHYATLQE